MSKKYSRYVVILLFSAISFTAYGQAEKMHSGPYLFADREFCVSGDTIWFKVFHENGEGQKGNIAHVQLTTAENILIAATHKKSTAGWAEGYILVPDSLSSGVYFLSAFFYGQNDDQDLSIQKRSLFVYNRFQKMVTGFPVPVMPGKTRDKDFKSQVTIKPGKTLYKPREKVSAAIDMDYLHSAGIHHVAVKAEYLDELAAEAGGNFYVPLPDAQNEGPDFEETDGILIKGKVVSQASGKVGENVMMLLSLINDPHYFDYYITSPDGMFYFFLKDAYGAGEIVLQAFSESGQQLKVILETGEIDAREPVLVEKRMLTPGQSKFIEEMVDASFYSRLFDEAYTLRQPIFEMPSRYELPFYGNPYERVVLSEFIELPDFQEVSRELLHGVQFRQRENEITLRMLNLDANVYFEDQPFRLINGIPVFRNSLLASLGSNEIDYIDYVPEDRVYGDLRFSGVLAIYLKDKSNGWLNRQPNLFRFSVPLLQPQAAPSYMDAPRVDENIPDLRSVFYWQLHETKEPVVMEFVLSDVKGKIRISVEGVTRDGIIFSTSEIIEVR